jgi:hypothetical protein
MPSPTVNPTLGTGPGSKVEPHTTGRLRAEAAVSILFADAATPITPDEPAFFHDLNLDQLVDRIISGRDDYDLAPLFHTRLTDVAAIGYRHDVVRDLTHADGAAELVKHLRTFVRQMRLARERDVRAHKLHYVRQRERWFVAAVETYCGAVAEVAERLGHAATSSAGMSRITEYLRDYTAATPFRSLVEQTEALTRSLAAIRYTMHIHGNRIRVSPYDGEADYSVEVLASFEKFQQGAVKDYLVKLPETVDMDHIEAAVLDQVAKHHPETFAELEAYCVRNAKYADPTVTRFERELQVYLAYLEFIEPVRVAGLPFCLPRVVTHSKHVKATETFDLALADKLVSEREQVVTNDFHLDGAERVLVISGPNQGGKTTLARTFGQLHYLGMLGLPVPGREVTVFCYDRMFTHFERGEDLDTVNGKLQDDLARVHAILQRATADSVVIMNEIFNSTTLDDAIFLGTEILDRILELDLLGVCVTFIDELSTLSEKTVSMVSTVVPDDPAVRTFKLIRRPADGRAYATAIAEKYRLNYPQLRERVTS